MSLASVASPFRLPFGDHDRLRGHRGAIGSDGRDGMGEPPGVIPGRAVLAVMGASALVSEARGSHDDSADGQQRLQLQERRQLVVVALPLVRYTALPVPRR